MNSKNKENNCSVDEDNPGGCYPLSYSKCNITILDNISWQELLKNSLVTAEEIAQKTNLDIKEIKEVIKKYPARINPYYFSLIKQKNDPIWLQCIPNKKELNDSACYVDPLNEENQSPIANVITHRYPDRVLFLVCNQCAMYCRFCTRKRKVGDSFKKITWEQIMDGIQYIRDHSEIRDIILSGGDPLLLPTSILEKILKELRSIKHIEIIRIGTRVPCTLPQRIDQDLCNMLKKYHPIFINTHFNHPSEITPASSLACKMLADSGIPLGNQTVLLKGVNDNPKIMKKLMQELLKIRVKPYYIYQTDMTKGTNHFRTKISKGLEIIKNLRGFTSGLAVPHYIIDAPGGGGKIPILPNYIVSCKNDKIILKNYKDNLYEYIEPS
jgi:lysine 2,3-aminomutase